MISDFIRAIVENVLRNYKTFIKECIYYVIYIYQLKRV